MAGFGSRARPGPPVRTPGPHCGGDLRSPFGAARPAEGEHRPLPMSPPRAGTSRPQQEPRSDPDAKAPELAGTPVSTGRERAFSSLISRLAFNSSISLLTSSSIPSLSFIDFNCEGYFNAHYVIMHRLLS